MKKVKDVVRISGLSRRTLQYYDDIGLMNVKRSQLNYRLYSEEDMDRLWDILVYKEAGLPLNEIRALMEADEKKKERAFEKELEKIRSDLDELERKHRFIKKIIEEGVPDRELVCRDDEEMTYREMVRALAERV